MSDDQQPEQPTRQYSLQEMNEACDRVFLKLYGTTHPTGRSIKSQPEENGTGKGQVDQFANIRKLLKD